MAFFSVKTKKLQNFIYWFLMEWGMTFHQNGWTRKQVFTIEWAYNLQILKMRKSFYLFSHQLIFY